MINFVLDELHIQAPLDRINAEFSGLSATVTAIKKFDVCSAQTTAAAWQTVIFDNVQLYEILFEPGYLDDDVRRVVMLQFEQLEVLDRQPGMSTRDHVASEVRNFRPTASLAGC